MDGFSGFKSAAADELPDAVPVMDPFHFMSYAQQGMRWTTAADAFSKRRAGIADVPATRSVKHDEHCTPALI